MKRTILLLLLAASCTARADTEKKPYAVYSPNRSCLYTFVGNETFVTCDESASYIASLYDKENQTQESEQKKDQEKRDDYARRRAEREQARDAEYDQKLAEQHQKLVDDLMAQSPRGWACVAKRLPPGVDVLASTDHDAKVCEKEFNADDRPVKKKSKKS
jgi:hypothetical protein